ncbi:MAG: peptidyl-prolyl cis-trans isomerase [Verrucomicrobia bacterium]|nr:peptidyl-prolyl cis-trans isomerase [Verrucomicrobiota bacterium]
MRSILTPFGLFLILGFAAGGQSPTDTPPAPPDAGVPPSPKQPKVILRTSQGDITLELNAEKAPLTVSNFLAYVDAGHFNGTIFHRVINGFMIQGGGFTRDMAQKPTREPIRNEADNGLKNKRGTIAMARTADIHSASAQFFINVADNTPLDHTSTDPRGFGYCVFGRVVEGMDVVDRIKSVATGRHGPYGDVPVEAIEITEAVRKP